MVTMLNNMFALMLLLLAQPAAAIFVQTGSDLSVLADALESAFTNDPSLKERSSPLLLAEPQHHWKESRSDFAAAAMKLLTTAYGNPQLIIPCPDCNAWRVHVEDGARLDIYNGEPSLGELGRLRKNARYAGAKALATIRETPAGVEFSLMDLNDGHLLWHRLADSSEHVRDVKPFDELAQERDRRLRGEALSYVFINIGLVPNGLAQVEFVEQWGERNQHISGISLSLLNPNVALGAVYHYMIPRSRRLHVSGAVFFPLQNAFASVAKDNNAVGNFVGQGMVQYTFANSYGVFAAVSSQGQFSIGLNFYNPLFMPFLL